MPYPLRMNLTSVKVSQLKAASAVQADPDYRRPRTETKFMAETELRCQVAYNAYNAYSPRQAGDASRSSGHLTFRKSYLDDKGVTLKIGDKVTAVLDRGVTFRTVDFRLVQVRPAGHLPNPGLVIADFVDAREERSVP